MKKKYRTIRTGVFTVIYVALGFAVMSPIAFSLSEQEAQNIQENIAKWRMEAEKGNMFGQYRLALCFFTGKGVEQDIPEAIKLIQSASQKGCLSTQTVLGSSYLTGYSVEKDEELGIKLVRDVAQKGAPTAEEIFAGDK